MAAFKREISFIKQTVNSYFAREWIDGELVDKRMMTADQVGKREAELIREGFRLFTNGTPGHRRYTIR